MDELLGAEMVYASPDDKTEPDRILERVTEELKAQGRQPYLIPIGGSTPLGCVAYVLAVGELLEQLQARQIKPNYIFTTTGSCGTHAGILAGVKYYGAAIPVYGISVSRTKYECSQRVGTLVQKTTALLNRPLSLEAGEMIVNDAYIGPGYAIITPAAREAIRTVARLEGVFLDPVYTGKTMAGLIDLVQRGEIARGATVVFWHTGGAPGLFGFSKDFQT